LTPVFFYLNSVSNHENQTPKNLDPLTTRILKGRMQKQTQHTNNSVIIPLPMNFTASKIGIHTHSGNFSRFDFISPAIPNNPARDSATQRIVHKPTAYFSHANVVFDACLRVQASNKRSGKRYKSFQRVRFALKSHHALVGSILFRSSHTCHRAVAENGPGGRPQ